MGFADANIIRDQEADRVQAQCHEQRDELVNPWPNGDATERPEWCRAIAQREPSRLPQKVRAGRIGKVLGRRERKVGWTDALFRKGRTHKVGQTSIDRDHITHCARQRAKQMDFVGVTW
jgi:hypothetical protein